MNQTLNISTSTIFRFILIILGLVFLYLIRDILLMIFVAMIIAAAIDAPVCWLARHKVRRGLGVTMVYVAILLLLALFVYLVFPALAGQIKALAANLPSYLSGLGTSVSELEQKISMPAVQQILENVSNQLSEAATNAFGTVINVFGGIFSALVILVASFYLSVQDKGIKKFIAVITPVQHRPYVTSLTERIQLKLGSWLRGQLLLMLIVGLMIYIGLTLLKVKFALTLALIAGLLEIVPYIGPILGAVPALAMSFLQSPLLIFVVAALFVLVQQMENYIFTPLILRKVVGLNPLIIMISIIVGGKLGGVLGAVVAVPLVAAVSVFLGDMLQRTEEIK
ncbi:MAG: AI-2E family transporter [Candidatus Portnoybacteria bacterium]|jgi:predicted PurR-regulated permease PerM|nr:AI-2E family transporter [Candidatus Portnoybacteria bacterium]